MDVPLLVSGGFDNIVKFWNPQRADDCLRILQLQTHVNAMEFSPDRASIAIAGYESVRFYDVDSVIRSAHPQPISAYEGHTGNVTSLGFELFNNWYFTTGEDGNVKIWDTRATGNQMFLDNNGVVIHTGIIHPDQSKILIGDQNGTVQVWDLRANKILDAKIPERDAPIKSLAISSSGETLLIGNYNGHIHSCSVNENGFLGPTVWFAAHEDYILQCRILPRVTKQKSKHNSLNAKIGQTSTSNNNSKPVNNNRNATSNNSNQTSQKDILQSSISPSNLSAELLDFPTVNQPSNINRDAMPSLSPSLAFSDGSSDSGTSDTDNSVRDKLQEENLLLFTSCSADGHVKIWKEMAPWDEQLEARRSTNQSGNITKESANLIGNSWLNSGGLNNNNNSALDGSGALKAHSSAGTHRQLYKGGMNDEDFASIDVGYRMSKDFHLSSKSWVWDIRVSCDGKYLFAAGTDGSISLHDISSGERVYVTKNAHTRGISALALWDYQAPHEALQLDVLYLDDDDDDGLRTAGSITENDMIF